MNYGKRTGHTVGRAHRRANTAIPVMNERIECFNEKHAVVINVCCCYNRLPCPGMEIKPFSRCSIFRAKNIYECKDASKLDQVGRG